MDPVVGKRTTFGLIQLKARSIEIYELDLVVLGGIRHYLSVKLNFRIAPDYIGVIGIFLILGSNGRN